MVGLDCTGAGFVWIFALRGLRGADDSGLVAVLGSGFGLCWGVLLVFWVVILLGFGFGDLAG